MRRGVTRSPEPSPSSPPPVPLVKRLRNDREAHSTIVRTRSAGLRAKVLSLKICSVRGRGWFMTLCQVGGNHRWKPASTRACTTTTRLALPSILMRSGRGVKACSPCSCVFERWRDYENQTSVRKGRNPALLRLPLDGCTWRTRLIKVAAEVITRARRVIVRLSANWPHLDHFLAVSKPVTAPPSG